MWKEIIAVLVTVVRVGFVVNGLRNTFADYESDHHYLFAIDFQYIYDVCLVWPPQIQGY